MFKCPAGKEAIIVEKNFEICNNKENIEQKIIPKDIEVLPEGASHF